MASIGLAAFAVAGALVLGACGSSHDAPPSSRTPAPAGLRIAFVPKQLNNPYFTVSDRGGEDAVTALKGRFTRVGPSTSGPTSQVAYINALITRKEDAIVISANDPNAVLPALKKARAAGIKVVTYDSDAARAGRDVFVNQASAEDIGRSEVRLLAKQLGAAGGQIAILSSTPNATNQNTWIGFIKDELAKPAYAKLKLVTTVYGDDEDARSFQQTQGLLEAYPHLRGIISPTTVGIAAAARYLQSSRYKGVVKLTGLGTPNQLRKFVMDGTIEGFELWDPAKLGYLAGYAAAALASGSITGKEGDAFDAGSLGRRVVGAHGEVVLGPPTLFDRINIDQFDF